LCEYDGKDGKDGGDESPGRWILKDFMPEEERAETLPDEDKRHPRRALFASQVSKNLANSLLQLSKKLLCRQTDLQTLELGAQQKI